MATVRIVGPMAQIEITECGKLGWRHPENGTVIVDQYVRGSVVVDVGTDSAVVQRYVGLPQFVDANVKHVEATVVGRIPRHFVVVPSL